MFAKAQESAQSITEQQYSSPSPTAILKSVNSSGIYMCSQLSASTQMQSPTVTYHEIVRPSIGSQNMMEHRNTLNKMCHQPETTTQFEFDDENSGQQLQQFQHNTNFSFSQNQISALNETQQAADQQTIELRMNNLGNENAS